MIGLAAEQQQRSLHARGADDRHHLLVVRVAEREAVDPRADMPGEVGRREAASGGGGTPVQSLHGAFIARIPNEKEHARRSSLGALFDHQAGQRWLLWPGAESTTRPGRRLHHAACGLATNGHWVLSALV